MAGESLNFPITADDRASSKFRDVGNAAAGAAGKISIAAKALDLWNDTAVNSGKADGTLIASKLAVARAFLTLGKAERFAADEAARAERLSAGAGGDGRGGGGFTGLLRLLSGGGRGLGGLGAVAGSIAGLATAAPALGAVAVTLVHVGAALTTAAAGLGAFGILALPTLTKLIASSPGIRELHRVFASLVAALRPDVVKIFNQAIQILVGLLPQLLPFADATAKAIEGLLKGFAGFANSNAFLLFLNQMAKLTGPTITALGKGFGQIAIAVGKLLLAAARPDSLRVLARILGFTAAVINGVAWAISRASGNMQKWVDIAHQTASKFDEFRHDTARAFAGVATIFDETRHAIANWAHGVAGNFDDVRRVFAIIGHDIASAFDVVRHAIAIAFDSVRHFQGQFDAFGKDVTFVKEVIGKAFIAIWHGGAVAFDALRHAVAASWDWLWKHVTAVLDGLRHDIAAAWNRIWSGTTSQVQGGINGIVGWFERLPGKVIGALFGLGHQLYAFGHAALGDFWNGLKSIAGSIFSWIGNFVATIWDKVKKFFGIASPSSLFYSAGKNLMLGLFHGIRDHAHHAANAARAAGKAVSGSLAGGPGGGAPSANAALARQLFPQWASGPLWAAWNYVAMRESGWNQFARNPSSGAYGIPQALPPTKMPFAAQAAGGSNPTAQIRWMAQYMSQAYGGPAGAAQHELAFGWYDRGGWLPPGVSMAVNTTGRPERVGGGEQRIVLEFRSGSDQALTGALVQVLRKHVRTVAGGDVQIALGHR